MSEQDYPNNLNNFEDNFDIDTRESKLIRWAHGLEDKYNGAISAAGYDTEATSNLMHAFQSELNSEFPSNEYAFSDVFVTGCVTQSKYDQATNSYGEETVEYKTKSLGLAGYGLEVYHDDNGHPVARVCYRFDTKTTVLMAEIASTRDTLIKQYAQAPIGSVEVRGRDFGLRELDDVEHYHPEVVAEIKGYAEAAKDESELLNLLAEQRIPANGSIDQQSLNTMQNYIINKLDFDVQVPYSANLQGSVMVGDITKSAPVTLRYVAEETSAVISPVAITLARKPEYTQSTFDAARNGDQLNIELSEDYHWQLVVNRYPQDRKNELEVLTLPLSSVKKLLPLRQIVDTTIE